MYEIGANLILFFHFIFILFVVFGALLFFASAKIIFIQVNHLLFLLMIPPLKLVDHNKK